MIILCYSLAVLAAVSALLTISSQSITRVLDTRYKFTGKETLRILFNTNEVIKAKLWHAIHWLISSKFKGSFGGRVDYMIVYPMKEASAGVKVTKWTMKQYGLRGDRQYLLGYYNKEEDYYEIILLNKSPKLALLKVEYDENHDQFIYSWTADKKETFSLPPEVDEHFINQWSSNGLKEVTIKSYASYIRGISLDKFALPQSLKKKMNLPENTKLLCSIKGKPCTVGVPKQRKISTVFQAYYPLLICSNESMDALKEKSLDSSYDLRMIAFRPNLIIKDVPYPFSEDYYEDFDLVSNANNCTRHTFKAPLRCIRCALPNVDYEKGSMDKSSTMTKTLAKFRRVDENYPYEMCFGKYAVSLDEDFTIQKGDQLDVLLKQVTYWKENPYKKQNREKVERSWREEGGR